MFFTNTNTFQEKNYVTKKAIDNWKRTEYLLIKNRKKQQQIQSYRDDDHANDLWYVLIQALTPQKYGEIEKLAQEYCDVWVKFWDAQTTLLQKK